MSKSTDREVMNWSVDTQVSVLPEKSRSVTGTLDKNWDSVSKKGDLSNSVTQINTSHSVEANIEAGSSILKVHDENSIEEVMSLTPDIKDVNTEYSKVD